MVEQLDGRLRHAEGRDARILKQLARLAHLVFAHPAADQRAVQLVGHLDDRLGDGQRIGHRLRRQHDQRAVYVAVVRHGHDGVAVALRRGIAADVDRVGVRPVGRHRLVEHGHRFVGQLGQRNAQVAGTVGGHGARPAAVGDDGQAVTQRAELGSQRLGGVEQLADVLHAHHAGPAHGGVEHGIGHGSHAGVGSGGHGTGLVAAGLEQDDRLDAGGGTQGAHEAAGVTDAFDVHQDVVCAAVVDQVVEDLAEIDVGGHADGNHRREADIVGLGPVEHGGAHGAGLRDEGQVAGLGGDLGERGVEAQFRADDAQAVGAEDAHVVGTGDLEHLALQRGTDVAGLGEAGGNDDDVAHAAAAALFDQLRNRLRAGGDDRHFDPGADFLDRLVGLLALDGVVLGVDGVQAALVTRAEDVLEDDVADRVLTVGSADYGNRFRFEKPSEIVLFQHGEPPC